MRKPAAAVAFGLVALGVLLGAPRARAQVPPNSRTHDDLSRARVLDKEGAKAYADGRYHDAIRYFEEAYRLGGPPFELWNVAKCRLRLDQPEQAAEALEQYLAKPNLPADDREQAERELDALKKRSSTLTVSSTPAGATVTIDGRTADEGKTPVSVTIAPGPHTVVVTYDDGNPASRRARTHAVEARYGRAVILDADLTPPSPAPKSPPPPPPEPEPGRTSIRAGIALVLPRHGEVSGESSAGFDLRASYRVASAGSLWIGAGALLAVNGDEWKNRIEAPNMASNCRGSMESPLDATALSVFATGSLSAPIVRHVRVVGLGGIGGAAYLVDDVSGDLFVPSCSPSTGLKPALLLGAEVDWAVTNVVHLYAKPLAWQVQPAFGGVRSTPVDASGVWMRFSFALGGGVDF